MNESQPLKSDDPWAEAMSSNRSASEGGDDSGQDEEKPGKLAMVIGTLIFITPVLWAYLYMRYHIPKTLDGDLQWIFSWFVDGILYFLIGIPAFIATEGSMFQRLVLPFFKQGVYPIAVGILVLLLIPVIGLFAVFHFAIQALVELIF